MGDELVTPKVAVNAFVFDGGGRILLARRADNGLWCVPGGHVDLGETVAGACLRELHEETGLKAEVVRLVGVYSDPAASLHHSKGPQWHTIRLSFLCRATGGTLSTSDETSEVQYFPLDALPPLMTDHERRIRDAVGNDREAVIA